MTCCAQIECTPPFSVGEGITSTVTITNPATGALMDLSASFAWSQSPTGAVTPLSVTHVSTGTYQFAFTPTAPNTWGVLFSDSASTPEGATVTISRQFAVFPILFAP